MNNKNYGPTILRIALALLFIIPGIGKLMNPSGVTEMLTGLGFPVPSLFAWILLLSEIIFGITLLLGWKVKYTVWPLFIVLLVATLLVVIPSFNTSDVGAVMNLLWHILGMAALITITLTGPGKLSIE